MTRRTRWAGCAGVAGVVILLATLLVTKARRRQEADTGTDEQKIARTLEIIRTSTPKDRKVLRVLFYGQSITLSGWHNAVVAHWRQVYPNTVFVVQNRAIGGFDSQELERTTAQDLAAFYPDLIIFHAYGDHRAYERVLRIFRAQTSADVILQTDHEEVLSDPVCTEGLQFSWRRKPGCAGWLWVHQKIWGDEMSYHKIPAFGNKFGMAVEPQRKWWRDYLLRTGIAPASLLVDEVHPNVQGKALMAGFFNQYFDGLVNKWSGQEEPTVLDVPDTSLAATVTSTGEQQTLQFHGERLELISGNSLAWWPHITVDGVPPEDLDGCYRVTRASPISTVPEWPAVRRISLMHDHTPEVWTATIDVSPDQSAFVFHVNGSRSGDQGSGDSAHTFIAKSGSLKIEPDDWMLGRAFAYRHLALTAPETIHWSVEYACGGQPDMVDLGGGQVQYRYLLAAGLPDTDHTAKITLPIQKSGDSIEFREYKPAA